MFKYKVNNDLYLKILEQRDAKTVFQLVEQNRAELAKWLPWVHDSKDAEDTLAFIQHELERFARNNGFSSGIYYKDEFAGCISVHTIDWNNRRTSFGYWLGSKFQGHGIMTASCKSLVDYCFRDLGLNRVEIRARVNNAKSRAIPERLGFVNEGVMRQGEFHDGHYYDHVRYSVLANEWTH